MLETPSPGSWLATRHLVMTLAIVDRTAARAWLALRVRDACGEPATLDGRFKCVCVPDAAARVRLAFTRSGLSALGVGAERIARMDPVFAADALLESIALAPDAEETPVAYRAVRAPAHALVASAIDDESARVATLPVRAIAELASHGFAVHAYGSDAAPSFAG